ncbi:hypothetical protein GYMLUDRAFT_60046 [Collybiopsis luxurians FD-317 M1]|uniref:Uncharacterized protein n=1 Tax=Collybiopsis luxurians FD-317 M1 TaxID=944289 RepID=A0A0D0B7K1_9AGAR|nr:hypothetical protein GYMLUDRAFT_60046 [Collybiopsis luxurians FD-317 M1]
MDSDTLDLRHCTTCKCQGQIECINPTCAHLSPTQPLNQPVASSIDPSPIPGPTLQSLSNQLTLNTGQEDSLALYPSQKISDDLLHTFQLDKTQGAATLIVSSSIKELQGYKWFSNSCWIDASLEALFWSSNFCWKDLESLCEGSPDHNFFAAYQALRSRRLLLAGNPADVLSMLSVQCNALQKYVKKNGFGFNDNLYDFDAATSWIASLLDISKYLHNVGKHPLPPNGINLFHFFGLETVSLKWCSGIPGTRVSNAASIFHIQLVPPHPGPSSLAIAGAPLSTWEEFQGKFQRWIQSLTDVKAPARPLESCWRMNSDILSSQGQPVVSEICTSFPILWIVSQHTDHNDKPWDYPYELFPVSGAEAKTQGCIYKMTACMFFNGNHYISHYIVPTDTPKRQIASFFYDGANNKGNAVREQGSLKSLYSGTHPPLPPSYKQYTTCAVIYRLDGGTVALKWFHQHQISSLAKQHVDISGHGTIFSDLLPVQFTNEAFVNVPLEEWPEVITIKNSNNLTDNSDCDSYHSSESSILPGLTLTELLASMNSPSHNVESPVAQHSNDNSWNSWSGDCPELHQGHAHQASMSELKQGSNFQDDELVDIPIANTESKKNAGVMESLENNDGGQLRRSSRKRKCAIENRDI